MNELDLHLHELQLLQRSANPCNSSTYFMFDPDKEEKHEKNKRKHDSKNT